VSLSHAGAEKVIRYVARATHVSLSHAGAEKVIRYVADNYDMSNIKEAVKDTVRQCEACQRTKVTTTKTKEVTVSCQLKNRWRKSI
jgi:sulfur relay (sulfurtransferase) DsrC/TusE family protein